MGVEPTAARSARPAANFEDWGIHRNSRTPVPQDNALVPVRQALRALPLPHFLHDDLIAPL